MDWSPNVARSCFSKLPSNMSRDARHLVQIVPRQRDGQWAALSTISLHQFHRKTIRGGRQGRHLAKAGSPRNNSFCHLLLEPGATRPRRGRGGSMEWISLGLGAPEDGDISPFLIAIQTRAKFLGERCRAARTRLPVGLKNASPQISRGSRVSFFSHFSTSSPRRHQRTS
ncbi:unnamed protein product [Trypanosoma congolense IL3000]|uniref:WGS project CAEQ00000000 data, annotated contig 185 n=1 Tax=Trypanosoma congolense (strain IL3000) TaxID=1068625 RepID=F9W9D6_TRYCI|nr:unnamed protein product [Trypanosoma congolense IL3000]